MVYPVIFFSILASLALKISITQKIRPVVILFHYGESWNLLRADQQIETAHSEKTRKRFPRQAENFSFRASNETDVLITRVVIAGNDSNLLIVFYVQRAFTDKQQIKRKAQSFD